MATANPFDEFDEPKKDANPFDEFDAPIAASTAPAPEPAPLPPRELSFGEKATRKGLAVASGLSDVVPFAPQIIARLRTLKGPETYEEELAGVREEKAMIEEGEPITTATARALGTLGALPALFAAAEPIAAAAPFLGGAATPAASSLLGGLYGGAKAGEREGSTATDVAKGAAYGAAVPAMFKGASTVARVLSPTTTTGTLGTLGLRAAQTGVRAVPYGFLAEQPVATLLSEEATPAEKTEAGINLFTLPFGAVQELRQGTRRAAARQSKSVLSRAKPEARDLVAAEQEAQAAAAVRKQRALEAETEAARAKAAEEAISAQRKAETTAYEGGVRRETEREMQAAKAAADAQSIRAGQRAAEVTRAEQRLQLDAREQAAEQVQDLRRLAKAKAEEQALTYAQQQNDVATEARLWEQKNRRAQRAVKDEQRIMSSADRLAKGDQAAVAELQSDLARLKKAEDAISAGDDPSLRGAIAKEYQDMRHRLETALGFFRDGGVEPPPEYLQAYDSVRESYLRNTKAQGYTGFGTPDEQFLEDPKAWAERKKQSMLQKTAAERTGKEADLVAFLDSIVGRDYMAEARTTRAGPQVPAERLQEIFADQGLEYNGGPLFGPDGVPQKQAFVGGRTPNAPFTSAQNLAQSIERRRELQKDLDDASTLLRMYRRSETRVPTVGERRQAERLAEIQAQQAAGFSGLKPRQEIEQAVRGRMPVPAGMSEADILSAAGVSPTAAEPMTEAAVRTAANITPAEAARMFAERRAAAETGLEYGTPTPEADTLKRMDLDSATRAVYEMLKPEWLRGGVLARVPGVRVGGLAPGAEAPQYLGERLAENPTQTRFGLPFQAFAMADRFTRVLQRNMNVRSRYDQFVRGAAKRGRGEDLKGFMQDVARFIASDPEAMEEMRNEEAANVAP